MIFKNKIEEGFLPKVIDSVVVEKRKKIFKLNY